MRLGPSFPSVLAIGVLWASCALGQLVTDEFGETVSPERRAKPAQRTRPSTASTLIWQVQGGRVYPITGVDMLVHLSYQIPITNRAAAEVEIKSLDVLDPDKNYEITGVNRVLAPNHADVTNKVYRFSLPTRPDDDTNYSTKLGPGQVGTIYVDLSYPSKLDVPRRLAHRIVATVTRVNGDIVEFDITDDPTPVHAKDAVVLTPPLRGDGWVNFNGCCLEVDAHRWSANAIDGGLYAAEGFAVDFLRVNSRGIVYASGDGSRASDFLAYGADVLAAANGLVVEVVSNIAELPPGTLATPTVEQAAGNRIIVDIGDGRYVLYAHLQPGSPTVRTGQRVTRGQKLGLLGTSGNSDAPHLHFQVMDGPSSLKANAMPFVFDRMTVQGKYNGSLNEFVDQAMNGKPVQFDTRENGLVYERMPLVRYVMGYN